MIGWIILIFFVVIPFLIIKHALNRARERKC